MKTILLFVALALVAGTAIAQSNPSDLAFQAYKKGYWDEAIKQYKAFRLTNPDDVSSLIGIGSAEMKLGHYKVAIAYLDSVFQMQPGRSSINQADFSLAKCYSALGDHKNAFRYLEDAASHGAKIFGGFTDPLYKNIRSDARFNAVEERIRLNTLPGQYDSRYKKMDYFIGNWEVFLGDKYDQKVAVDTITSSPGGYAVFENFKWTSGGNYTGKSMTFLDPSTQKFRMCWAGSSGDIRNFEEVRSDENTMVFMAVTNTSENQLVHRRMTITHNPADGSVHEYIENSFDMGLSWVVDFDAMFRKTK